MIDKEFQSFIDKCKREAVGEKAFALGCYRFTLTNVITGEKEVSYYKNIIPNVGLTMIANNLTDASPDHPMKITHAALGSSVTAVAAGDTKLTTETYRNAIASCTNAVGVGYATAYFNQTEVTGTFRECGIFSDGTGAADSGVIVSHVSINISKTNVQTLTIDWTLTLTSA